MRCEFAQALLTVVIFDPNFLPVMGMISHQAWEQYNWLLDSSGAAQSNTLTDLLANMPWASHNLTAASAELSKPRASLKRLQAIEMLCGESSLPGAVQQRIHPKFKERLAASNAVIAHSVFWTETAFKLVRARARMGRACGLC